MKQNRIVTITNILRRTLSPLPYVHFYTSVPQSFVSCPGEVLSSCSDKCKDRLTDTLCTVHFPRSHHVLFPCITFCLCLRSSQPKDGVPVLINSPENSAPFVLPAIPFPHRTCEHTLPITSSPQFASEVKLHPLSTTHIHSGPCTQDQLLARRTSSCVEVERVSPHCRIRMN